MSQVLPDLPITISSQLDSYNSRVQLALYQWIQQSLNEGTGSFPGFAATAGQLTPGAAINGVNFTGASPITVAAAAGTLTGSTLAAGVVNSSLTSVGTLANLNVTGTVAAGTLTGAFTGTVPAANLTGTTLPATLTGSSLTSVGTLAGLTVTAPIAGSVTGNAATATALQTPRAINGVNFDGTAPITVAAAAGTLTGSTLAAGVTASSLTSVGTLANLTVTNPINGSVTGTSANVTGTVAVTNGGTGGTTPLAARNGIGIGTPHDQELRLTLLSGTPVTTADEIGISNLYLTPYKGDAIALYSGGAWSVLNTAEISMALSGLTSGTPYDVWAYNNAGVVTLELLIWTNTTTRATGLAYQNGVLVKSGDATRRYIGTIVPTAATTTEDSAAKRYVWNYYNRVTRKLIRTETTASWNYTTATVRQANGNSANKVEFVVGAAEDNIDVSLQVVVTNSSNSTPQSGIGLDSVTATHADSKGGYTPVIAGSYAPSISRLITVPTLPGYHYASWLETAQAVGTTTFMANEAASGMTNYGGLNGSMLG